VHANTENVCCLLHLQIEESGIFGEIALKLEELREFMKFQKQRLKERDEKENIAKQWKAVALVLDRVFFVFYLLVILASVCYTLPVLTAVGHMANQTRILVAKGKMNATTGEMLE
jgi:hypothetical protein